MVWTLSPPGVSIASVNSSRAGDRSAAGGWRLQFRERGGERVFGARNPVGQALEHPLGHFCGRGLGVGEAQDSLRFGTSEQQPQHTIGQHMRFAGAGVGRHPSGSGRIGGAALRSAGRKAFASDVCRVRHAASSEIVQRPLADARQVGEIVEVVAKA